MRTFWPRSRVECLGCLDGEKATVRIVVRDAVNRKYFVFPWRWTENLNEAHDFRTSARAIDAISQMHREGLEVALLFGDPAYDVTLPIGPATHLRKWARAS